MKKKIFAIISLICICSIFCITSFASGIIDIENNGEIPTIETFNPKITLVTRYQRSNDKFDTAYDFSFPHPILWNDGDGSAEYDTDGVLSATGGVDENLNPIPVYVESQQDFILQNYETIDSVMYGTYEVKHKQRETTAVPASVNIGRYIIIEDFYVWGLGTFEFSNRALSEIDILLKKATDSFVQAEITYRSIYDNNIYHQTIYPDDTSNNFTSSYIRPNIDMLEVQEETGMMYIQRMVLTLNNATSDNTSEFSLQCELAGSPRIDNYVFNYLHPESDNPAIDLAPFTRAVASAVAGFFSMEIFAGFTLGGIFMTTLAFICVVWWLKLIAGG